VLRNGAVGRVNLDAGGAELEDLSRQMLSETKVWEAIQEARVQLLGIGAAYPFLTTMNSVTQPVSLAFLSARDCLL
jgi:hypothetical protein